MSGSGKMPEAQVEPMMTALEAGLRDGKRRLFVDFFDLAYYPPLFRERGVQVCRAHLHNLTEIHVGLTSPLVRMGVNVANLVLRIMVTHNSRASFEAALRRVA